MTRTVIIENELDAQTLLSTILLEYCPTIELVGVAASVVNGIDLIEKQKPDLVFLDIEIDGGNSFDILDSLNFKLFKIIFTTAFDQYALKAFRYGALDYLLKPYSPKEVLDSLERVKETPIDKAVITKMQELIDQSNTNSNSRISIPTSEGISLFEADDIIRVEANGSYCVVYQLEGERLLVSKPLKYIEGILPSSFFVRVHSSHLINMNYVKRFITLDGGQIELSNGTIIPIARRRKQDFLKMLGE